MSDLPTYQEPTEQSSIVRFRIHVLDVHVVATYAPRYHRFMAKPQRISAIARFVLILCYYFLFSSPVFSQTGATLSGVVYLNGDAIPGMPVSLYSRDRVLKTKADKAGRFEFSGLTPGMYDLQTQFLGVEGTILDIRLEAKDLGPLTIDAKLVESVYPLSPDCGRTFWVSYKEDLPSSNSLSGNLLIYPEVPLPSKLLPTVKVDLTAGDSHRITQHADENGRFEFQNVPPGRYSMVVHHGGYWSVKSTVWIMRKNTTVTKIILYKHGHPAICE